MDLYVPVIDCHFCCTRNAQATNIAIARRGVHEGMHRKAFAQIKMIQTLLIKFDKLILDFAREDTLSIKIPSTVVPAFSQQ